MSVEPGDRVRYSEEFLDSLRTSRDPDELREKRGRCVAVVRERPRRIVSVEWERGGLTQAPARYFSRP